MLRGHAYPPDLARYVEEHWPSGKTPRISHDHLCEALSVSFRAAVCSSRFVTIWMLAELSNTKSGTWSIDSRAVAANRFSQRPIQKQRVEERIANWEEVSRRWPVD